MKNLLYIVFITLMWCLSLHAYAVNWDKLLVSYETGDTTKITKKYTIAISGVYAFVGDKKREVIVLKNDGNTWKPMQILKPTTKKRVEFGKKLRSGMMSLSSRLLRKAKMERYMCIVL